MFGRRRLGTFEVDLLSRRLFGDQENPRKASVRVTGNPIGIRTRYFSNTGVEHYRSTNRRNYFYALLNKSHSEILSSLLL
jgi:hypothetical protein